MSAALDELTATVLLGTERRPPSPPSSHSAALASAVERQPWDTDPPAALLAAAALLTAHDRAGRVATTLRGAVGDPAPGEQSGRCSPGAALLLEQLLSDRAGAPLVDEWLERLAVRGELALPVHLPGLLDVATGQPRLRAPLLGVGGARLRWLGAVRAEWSWATADRDEDPDRGWDLATFEARLLMLGQARAQNPDRGRELLERTWSADPAKERAKFLEALSPTLTASDEPLLEGALDDRRREVREAAADLLATLSGSAFQARMWARVEPLVKLDGRLRRRLAIALPPEPDDAARRDNVAGSTVPGLGRRAAHLAALVGATDLAAWTRHLNERPATIVALASGSDNADALIAGWLQAAERQRNPEWCAALAVQRNDPRPLVAVPATAVEEAAMKLLGGAEDELVLFVLRWLSPPWPESVSALAVKRLRQSTARNADLTQIAYNLHPAVIENARVALGELEPPAVAFVHVLELRQALIRELPTP